MPLPRPYYEHAGFTIYHADCSEILPQLSCDVVLTDPPWELSGEELEIRGRSLAPRRHKSRTLKRGAVGAFDPAVLVTLQSIAKKDCLFLCGYKELGDVCKLCQPLRGVFAWQKPNAAPAAFYPAALDLSFIVWTGKKSFLYGRQHWRSMVFSVPVPNAGCMKTERYLARGSRKALHPCQGPVALYHQLLRPFAAGTCVLDAYMGTGTTLRAAKDLGLKAIGIERDESYCELAARRLDQGVFSFSD